MTLHQLDPCDAGHPLALRRERRRAPEGLILRHRPGGERLYADRCFEAGEPVLSFRQVIWRPEPDAWTIEHPCGRHFFDPSLAHVSRIADPNCRLEPELMMLIARRDICRSAAISIAGTRLRPPPRR
jgi:hypothetical protein